MLLSCGIGEDSWESHGLQGDSTSPSWRRSVLGVHWKDWCWSWNSNTLATSCEELTHWKRPWCWEGLGAGGEGDDRGWDVWMASLTRWAWVWVNFGSSWWTGRPGMLQFMGLQRVRHDWATELNWSFQLLWVDTKEHDFWIVWWEYGELFKNLPDGHRGHIMVMVYVPTSSERDFLSHILTSTGCCHCSGHWPF